jgi:hypothetical protein
LFNGSHEIFKKAFLGTKKMSGRVWSGLVGSGRVWSLEVLACDAAAEKKLAVIPNSGRFHAADS